MGLEPLADKWRAFGFEVREVDGHDFAALAESIDFSRTYTDAPVVIIAHTIKGKGVDFMENDVRWHYGGLDTDLIAKAKASVDRMDA
jgi:transketolase